MVHKCEAMQRRTEDEEFLDQVAAALYIYNICIYTVVEPIPDRLCSHFFRLVKGFIDFWSAFVSTWGHSK